jgi:hypothetical protein
MKVQDRIDMLKADVADGWRNRMLAKLLAVLLGVYLFVVLVLAIIWSAEPERFDVNTAAQQYSSESGQPLVAGSVMTSALINVAKTLLEKPGGFLSNDITLPGVALDNMPSWEYGALIQLRDVARASRESFSRSQSQSTEDVDLALAEPRFNFGNNWLFPRSEDEYRDGIEYVERYRQRLAEPGQASAQFYARADNLASWLAAVETRLGSLSQRLSASVGQRRLNTDLAGDKEATQSTIETADLLIKTPWHKVDNVLYEARGATWALSHFLRAAEQEFADVLDKKNARVSLQQIIRELEATQQTIWSPVVLNGSGFGLFANHSLVMASYIARANAAIIDLRTLLTQG